VTDDGEQDPSIAEPVPPAEVRRPGRSFGAEIRDAVSGRSFALVIGVLVLQLGFVLSYVGAFHAPKPHHIPIAVVAPAQISAHLVGELNALPSTPVKARTADSESAARQLVNTGKTSAALIVNPTGNTDTLLVASGGGASVVTALETITTKVEASQHRTATFDDIVPLQSGDGRGLTGFYLVIGWLVGGYLVASAFGVAKGARPANTRRTTIRLLALIPYAVVSGIGGTLIVDQVLGALTGHFLALALLGMLLVYAAGAVTIALQILFGVIGIGLTVLIFVVLGNPSAGGAYQTSLLPPFWRTISGAIPNGAGVNTLRRIVYFGAHGITDPLLVISAYAVGGTVIAAAASILRVRRLGDNSLTVKSV
jgi:hypothetical protein